MRINTEIEEKMGREGYAPKGGKNKQQKTSEKKLNEIKIFLKICLIKNLK